MDETKSIGRPLGLSTANRGVGVGARVLALQTRLRVSSVAGDVDEGVGCESVYARPTRTQ